VLRVLNKMSLLLSTEAAALLGAGISAFEAELSRIKTASDMTEALSEGPFDLIILTDEAAAISAAESSTAAVWLLSKNADAASLAQHGLIAGGEDELERIMPMLIAIRARLRALESRANKLQKKLYDTNIVSRAKLILMSRFSMSEKEAHRYIEKTAMDSGRKRLDVAESIIRTYGD